MRLVWILCVVLALNVATAAGAAEYVRGYTKKNGTRVEGHYRSGPNKTKADNYSTEGNTNPYTGQQGKKRITGNGKSSRYRVTCNGGGC